MPLPLSFDRVLAAINRNTPAWISTSLDGLIGKEHASISVLLGRVADRLEAFLDELLPDTTTQLLPRWEFVTRNPTRPFDMLAARRDRVLSVLRKSSGPRLSQLAKVLAPSMALPEDEIIFFEAAREFIEDSLLVTSGVINAPVPAAAPKARFNLGKPWPGVVDDTGVRVFINLTDFTPGNTATLNAPNLATWTFELTGESAWYENRTAFLGIPAGGEWTLVIADATTPDLVEWKLLVSNDDAAGHIYNFFAYRDPDAAGAPDLQEAQRLFHDTALGHMRPIVCESLSFKASDPKSLCDRDPLGGV